MPGKNEFRRRIASRFKENTRISRDQIFGHLSDKYRPLNLRKDAEVMFAGYVGANYRPGGCVVLAINPGGGGDAYAKRTQEDEVFYPLLYALKLAVSPKTLEAFERVNSAFEPIVQCWNLWRILGPTIDATSYRLDQIAYLNAVPYRTKEDKIPPVYARKEAWEMVTGPSLELLQPQKIIALGKKAGDVLERFYEGNAQKYCIPRTIGDSYISVKAEKVLKNLTRIRNAH